MRPQRCTLVYKFHSRKGATQEAIDWPFSNSVERRAAPLGVALPVWGGLLRRFPHRNLYFRLTARFPGGCPGGAEIVPQRFFLPPHGFRRIIDFAL